MRYLFILLSFIMTSPVSSQTIQQMSFDQLQKRLHERKEKIVVVNFWATWCGPCVEELPNFEKLNEKYSSQKVKVILVNLDFNSAVKSSVEPFVKNKNLKSEVWHITDTDPNKWINKADSSWSGAIPVTMIFNASHKKIFFREEQLTFEELEKVILTYLK